MITTPTDFSACDVEPIHIPGSIQPHGMMLLCDAATLTVSHVAGDVEGRLGCTTWQGATLQAVIGRPLAERAGDFTFGLGSRALGQLTAADGECLDVSAHLAGLNLIVELEPPSPVVIPAISMLANLEAAANNFARAGTLKEMCESAAIEFRRLTGFDRVMVYRFLGDDTGFVIAENRRDDMAGFLNHHFPASDIPRQARALYVRNLTRTIPDITYGRPLCGRPGPMPSRWI